MAKLLILFVVVPAVELILLIEIGERIGALPTVGLIIVTGIVGAALARHQGTGVLLRIQGEMAEGRMPAGSLVDGVIILVAGALLITPGVLTDIFGFLCLVPAFRGVIKRVLRRRMERAVAEGRVQVHVDVGRWGPGGPGSGGPGPDGPERLD